MTSSQDNDDPKKIPPMPDEAARCDAAPEKTPDKTQNKAQNKSQNTAQNKTQNTAPSKAPQKDPSRTGLPSPPEDLPWWLAPALFVLFAAVPLAMMRQPQPLMASAFLYIALIYLSDFDVRTFRLPDHGTLPLAASGLALVALCTPGLVLPHIIAAVITGGIFWSLSEIWWRFRGRDSLGLGDAKLATAGALWVGPGIAEAMLVGASTALLWGLAAAGSGRGSLNAPLPFGPFLSFGVWAIWCWRAPLTL